MELTNNYCRLCADLKQPSELLNMEINTEKHQEMTQQLTRFNIIVNFNNILPKTVCFECLNSLKSSYDFISFVDQAVHAFDEYLTAPDLQRDEVGLDTKDDSPQNTKKNIRDDISCQNEFSVQEPTVKEIKVKRNIKKSKKDINDNSTSLMTPIVSTKKQLLKLKPRKNTILPSQHIKPDTEPITAKSGFWQYYRWICALCDRHHPSQSELKVHSMQYHTTCNPYRCADCRGKETHIDNFVTHINTHRTDLSLSCYVCSVKFTSMKELKAHKVTHINSEYVCVGCNSTFTNQAELNKHTTEFYKSAEVKSSMLKENTTLTCVFCEKTSKSKLLHNRHLLIHADRRRIYDCGSCNKNFFTKRALMQHAVLHSDERPYKCEVCKFSFKVKSEMKKHTAIHFGSKRYSCDKCGKSFRRSQGLARHCIIHKDARPFQCSECKKAFRFRHLMIQHFRLHSGEKPYVCQFCPLKFRNWSNCNKHSIEKHGKSNSKRKPTSDVVLPIDPKTKKVIYPEKTKVLEWQKTVLASEKTSRPLTRNAAKKSAIEVKSRKRIKKTRKSYN